jgi:hypothetical protein
MRRAGNGDERRRSGPGLIFHSDRGSQYTSEVFTKLLDHHGIRQSLSRPGQCWDNAVAESFFATLKCELVHRHVWPTRASACSATSSTSRAGTTAAAVTPRWAICHRPTGPVLGVCTGDGQSDEIPGAGQAELLEIVGVQSDGRDEILFGGTTVSARLFTIAIFGADDRLRRVRLGARALVLVEGLELDATKRVDLAGRAVGCEDVDGDGTTDLTQVTVRPRHERFRWTKTSYRLDRAIARVSARDSGWADNDPQRPDEGEIVEVARGLTPACEVKGGA